MAFEWAMSDGELPPDLYVPDDFYSEEMHALQPRMHYMDFGFHDEAQGDDAQGEDMFQGDEWTPPGTGEVSPDESSGHSTASSEPHSESEAESSDSEYRPPSKRPAAASPAAARSVRKTRAQVDSSVYLQKGPVPLNDRKAVLKHMKWSTFQRDYACTSPVQYPAVQHTYHPNMFMEDKEYEELKALYDKYRKTAFNYYKRRQGRSTVEEETYLPLNSSMNSDAWELFVGLTESEVKEHLHRDDVSKIYYTDVELLLQVLKRKSSNPRFMIRRREFRQRYVGDRKYRPFDLNDVIWMVCNSRDLPWMIPIENFHYHNPEAVYWKKATIYEMILCGRLVHANERLYKATKLYKELFPLIVHMNQHLVHVRDEPDLWEEDVWDNWNQGSKFFGYRPCFRVCVVPSLTLRYSMMLAFRKEVTRGAETQEIQPRTVVVPAYSHVYSFAGEVRPVDLSVDDNYAFELINNKGEKHLAKANRSSKSTRPELVCTNYILYDNRPGVGSAAYMANHTCGMGESVTTSRPKDLRPNEYFYMSEIRVGNKEGNAIANADMLTMFATLKSARDITAQNVTKWMDDNTSWLEVCLGNSMVTKYDLFPVEFVYNRDIPKDPSTVDSCMCMTRCNRHDVKSPIMIHNVCSLTARPSRESSDVLKEEIKKFIPEEKQHLTKRGYIREYLKKQGFGESAHTIV